MTAEETTKIEYQVDAQNNVFWVRPFKEPSYKIEAHRAEDGTLPWTPKLFSGSPKWRHFRARVLKQEPGVWYWYSGWPDKAEMKRATAAVGKIAGRTFQRSSDPENLLLGVRLQLEEGTASAK